MSHREQENQKTGPKEIFDILARAPPERLISLTLQLSESPEDRLIHALSLIVLQREEQALDKLQTLRDHGLAKHLVQRWEKSQGKLEDFAVRCARFQDFTLDSLVLLARVFKVLSEQRLCDPHLRNLAYKRALSGDDEKTSAGEDQAHEKLREEARVVCGFEERMGSSTYLKSGSNQDLQSSLGRGNTTLKMTLSHDHLDTAHSLPSPLQASSVTPSYPSHLEISIPPTALFQEDRSAHEMSGTKNLNTPVFLSSESEVNSAQGQNQLGEASHLKTCESSTFIGNKHSGTDNRFAAESIKSHSLSTSTLTPTPSSIPPPAASAAQSKTPVANAALQYAEEEDEDEDEAIFYAFVILHAPEDADMAYSMREKVEKVIGREGATFSDDFATAGKSTLRCVEDAINNTAFTLLLLTRNFNTHMQDLETNSALLNSVNKTHKHNTVIPLLPQRNAISRKDIPLVLQTIVPLVEDRSFEKKVLRSMSPANIRKQQKMWLEEQKVKRQVKRQERLKQLKQHQTQLNRESETAQSLERENIRLLMEQRLLLGHAMHLPQGGEEYRAWWQQQPNIHINNAKYIMIGNDSQMTVDLGGGADQDGSADREEEQ